MIREGKKSNGRGQRHLTPEEEILWRRVTDSVQSKRTHRVQLAQSGSARPIVQSYETDAAQLLQTRRSAVAPKSHPPLIELERRLKTRLSRGQMAPDAVLDLHGLRRSEAHDEMFAFLRKSQGRGARIILIITGKGKGDLTERGVLRQLAPRWLCDPRLQNVVLGFEEANRTHGGSGALYVRLRRSQTRHPTEGE